MKKLIGHIGVDAGLCWIGDPCYVVAKDSSDVFENWGDFCRQLFKLRGENNYASFSYKLGHEGLGVAVDTGYGDGSYPVYATFNKEGRVAKVEVKFI